MERKLFILAITGISLGFILLMTIVLTSHRYFIKELETKLKVSEVIKDKKEVWVNLR